MTNKPEWLAVLRAECEKTSISRTAAQLGLAKSTVSMVLNGKYKPETDRIKKAVEDHFMRNQNTVIPMKQESNMTEQADWLAVLAAECKKKSQQAVARFLGYSPSVINQALNGKYQGDLYKLEEIVRGAYMGKTVPCPVIRDLPRHQCIKWQGNLLSTRNPLRAWFEHACPDCPHNCRNQKENAA